MKKLSCWSAIVLFNLVFEPAEVDRWRFSMFDSCEMPEQAFRQAGRPRCGALLAASRHAVYRIEIASRDGIMHRGILFCAVRCEQGLAFKQRSYSSFSMSPGFTLTPETLCRSNDSFQVWPTGRSITTNLYSSTESSVRFLFS